MSIIDVTGWSLRPAPGSDISIGQPVVGTVQDGIIDLRFDSGQNIRPFASQLEPMNIPSQGDGYRCHGPDRDYWLKGSPELDGYAGTESS